jgi:hypothetical protein
MTFTDDEIEIRPGHQTRHWQSCDYFVGRTHLFHERAYLRSAPAGARSSTPAGLLWLASGPALEDATEQWFDIHGTRDEIETLAAAHGGEAIESFYPEDEGNPDYFLAFRSTDRALAFCRSKAFDALLLPQKLANPE